MQPVTIITHSTTEQAVRGALANDRGGRRGFRPAADDPDRGALMASEMRARRRRWTGVLTLELVRVTERAAIAAAMAARAGRRAARRPGGRRGDVGRAEPPQRTRPHRRRRGRAAAIAPKLYVGEEVGTGEGPEVDIAVDPLDGRTLCAKNLPNSLAAIAVTRRGGLLNAPDVYMEKIADRPGLSGRTSSISQMPPDEAIRRLAEAKGVQAERHLRLHPRPPAPRAC